MAPSDTSPTVLSRRERTRAATVDEIKTAAREQLAREGSASINLRAIARAMGVTPSALYRYFASRDEILTALITDAYNDVGAAVEASVAGLAAEDGGSRFLTATAAFRGWAHRNPSEYTLLFGSPVPGYVADPADTMAAAMRTSTVLLDCLSAGLRTGTVVIAFSAADMPAGLPAVLAGVSLADSFIAEPNVVAAAMMAWATLLGFISCELFGHWPPEIAGGADELFEFTMRQTLIAIGTNPVAAAAAQLVPYLPVR